MRSARRACIHTPWRLSKIAAIPYILLGAYLCTSKKGPRLLVAFWRCPEYIQPNQDSSRPAALVNSSNVFVHRASCSRFSKPTVEIRLAYRLWTLTCPTWAIKTEGVGGSDLQNFALIHTSCTTITVTINALFYFYRARCRNW